MIFPYFNYSSRRSRNELAIVRKLTLHTIRSLILRSYKTSVLTLVEHCARIHFRLDGSPMINFVRFLFFFLLLYVCGKFDTGEG